VKTTPAHIARLDELRRYATLVDFLLVSERKIFPMKINRFGKAEILNPQEITLLFSEGLVKPRDRALFGVCLYAAARINESCTLQRGDIIGTRRRYSVADTRGNSRDRTPPVSGRIILPFGTLMLLIVSGSILLTMSQILAG
jgi:integrase